MTAKAKLSSAQCTPRKARLLRPLIIGKPIPQAIALLSAERRAGSVDVLKLIRSALEQLPKEKMMQVIVRDLVVNEGPRRTMYMPRAQGRASPVLKRTSHLTIQLELK